MKYREKPMVVQAYRWKVEDPKSNEWPMWMIDAAEDHPDGAFRGPRYEGFLGWGPMVWLLHYVYVICDTIFDDVPFEHPVRKPEPGDWLICFPNKDIDLVSNETFRRCFEEIKDERISE